MELRECLARAKGGEHRLQTPVAIWLEAGHQVTETRPDPRQRRPRFVERQRKWKANLVASNSSQSGREPADVGVGKRLQKRRLDFRVLALACSTEEQRVAIVVQMGAHDPPRSGHDPD